VNDTDRLWFLLVDFIHRAKRERNIRQANRIALLQIQIFLARRRARIGIATYAA
jgi:hypothetical protein